MLPRPIFLFLAVTSCALAIICLFYGLVAMVLSGPTALAIGCLLFALAMAYGLAVWMCLRCFYGQPPDWLDGWRATLIASTLGLAAAMPITIVGGYVANVGAVTLTAFLGGVIPMQVWFARNRPNGVKEDGGPKARSDWSESDHQAHD